MSVESAIKLARDLGLTPQEPDDGAVLAEEYGMGEIYQTPGGGSTSQSPAATAPLTKGSQDGGWGATSQSASLTAPLTKGSQDGGWGATSQSPAATAPLTKGSQDGGTRGLDIIEAEILFYKRQAGESILEIGKRLNEAKEQLSHGEWLPWLREKVDISERSAQNFMRLAREYSKSAEIADLGATKALALLALSDSERADFVAEKHEVDGVEKSVADMTGKELKQAIEDRDRALREAEEAKAGQAMAEQASEKMAVDMAHLKELAKGAQEAEEQRRVQLAKAKAEAAEKQTALDKARAELDRLKSRPVEVAVQEKDASPEQIAKAKAEAKAEAEKEIREAKAKAEQAEKELARARERAKEANERALKAQEDKAAAEKKARDAEKMARANGSEDMVRFKVLFENVQGLVNDMADVMETAEVDNRMKMEKALGALADQIGKVAGR